MPEITPRECTLQDGRKVQLLSPRDEHLPLYAPFNQKMAGETKWTMQIVGRIPAEERTKSFWDANRKSKTGLSVMALAKGEPVGLLAVHPEWEGHPWVEHLVGFGMFVLRDYWGSGLASVLVEEMHEHAKRAGIQRIEAMVRAKNERGVAFYKKHGYTIEGTRKHAAIIDGVSHDEYYIARLFL